jgi:hypothetical protein
MVRKTTHASTPDSPVEPVEDVAVAASGRVVERPDGYHGLSFDGRQEFGPFETFEEARASIDAAFDGTDGQTPVEGESLSEAQAEIGMADWLDPESGEPAEGGCPPHLEPE